MDNIRSFGSRALNGLLALLAQSVVARVIGFVSQLFLARLLLPNDFGLIGLTYTVTAIMALISGFGVDDVLVHRFSDFSAWRGTAFWISLGLGLISAAAMMIAAPAAAVAFKAPMLIGLLAFTAAAMPIGALASVPNAWLRAHMKFKTLSFLGALELLGSTILTIVLAWRGYGAYSFVIPVPLMSLFRVVTYWTSTPLSAEFGFRGDVWKSILRKSSFNSLNKFIVGLIGQGDYLILGLFASKSVVGYYYFAFRLAAQPFWMLANGFTNVVLPIMVQLNKFPERQRDVIWSTCRILNALVMPLALVEAGVARPLLHVLFGHKWDASVIPLQRVSIGLAFDAASFLTGALLDSRGEYSRTFRFLSISGPIFFGLVYCGSLLQGANGVATAVMIYYVLTQPPFVALTLRRNGIKFRQTLCLYLQPFLAAALPTLVGCMVAGSDRFHFSDLEQVVLIGSIGSIGYIVALKVLMPEVAAEMVVRLRGLMGARAMQPQPD